MAVLVHCAKTPYFEGLTDVAEAQKRQSEIGPRMIEAMVHILVTMAWPLLHSVRLWQTSL